jgi:hypothetical protein
VAEAPGEPGIVAWGYSIDRNGVSSGFNYRMGNDAPCRDALERSDAWFQEEVVNRSPDDNATCTSRTVLETFRRTGSEMVRIP